MAQQSTTISVVVTDVVGSTALSERRGPDKTVWGGIDDGVPGAVAAVEPAPLVAVTNRP